MLLEEFLKPLGISQAAFARRLGVSYPQLRGVIRARSVVTAEMALRLARVTGMTAEFWLGLQQDWDLWHAARSAKAAANRVSGAAASLADAVAAADRVGH